MITEEEMLDFLQYLKEKYKLTKFERWLFIAEARSKGWGRYDIGKALRNLHEKGRIKLGENFEIVVKE